MGYIIATDAVDQFLGKTKTTSQRATVDLEVPNTEIVTGQLGRDQRISVTRDGITVTFSRDERGKAGVCVKGEGRTDEELRAAGQELSQRVVQHYVHQRLMQEVQARGYAVVEESTDANQAIHMRIRHWEN